jgi:peptidoglycan/LPS O-acetylase OafA/YrhL
MPSSSAGVQLLARDSSGSASGDTSSARILELDGLRGIAIGLVLACHYLSGAEHSSLPTWLRKVVSATNIGWSGVDLFFVLSGFLIGGILLNFRDSPRYFRTFYLRRVHRILPIYYLWIILYLAFFSLTLFKARPPGPALRYDLLAVPIQTFFLQNLIFREFSFPHGWFAVTWSLAVEEQFYLFVPLLIRILSLRRLVTFLLASIVLAPFARLFAFHLWPGTLASMILLPCRSDALAIGILLAIAWREQHFRRWVSVHRSLLQYLLALLVLGAIGMLPLLIGGLNPFHISVGYSWFALLYGCLLLLAVSHPEGRLGRVLRWRPMRSLGKISYCVYLIHYTVVLYLFRWVHHTETRLDSLMSIATISAALIATLALATLSWRFLEQPLIHRGRHYSYREPDPQRLFTGS